MNHPLDGARLKIIRAQEHLDSLKAEVGMYIHEHPNAVGSQPTKHAHLGIDMQTLPPIIPDVPPLRLSAIIGDCVTNARAALDYIVWELAQRCFDRDITNGKDVAFPIFQSPTDMGLQNGINRLKNLKIPAGPITEIQATQPYNAGYESLGWLNELVNKDKHRTLLLTIGEFDKLTVTLATPPIYQDLIKKPATFTLPRHLATDRSPLQSDVQMKGEVAIYVTWRDVPVPREPVDRTIEHIIKTVANIIPRFDAFFS